MPDTVIDIFDCVDNSRPQSQSEFDANIRAELIARGTTLEEAREHVRTHNAATSGRHRILRQISNDISPIPEIENPERREACKYDLQKFAELYLPTRFYHRWSPAQLHLIECLQIGLIKNTGERQAVAMPRGSGKTTIVETALLWALLYGHCAFFLIICANMKRSRDRILSVQSTLLTNDELLADFPESCYPIRQAGGLSFRLRSQHCSGDLTNIIWMFDRFTLPMIPGAPAAGNIVQSASIGSSMRGLLYTTPDGRMLRPEYIVLDDVQDDKTARNPRLVGYLESQINGVIRGLAGPGCAITMTMPCTVIRKDDLAERFLDRETRPEWQGIRTKMLDRFPTNMMLWEKYYGIRQTSFRAGDKGIRALEFYRENQTEMDAGAISTWAERFNPPREISAIQHAMNLYFEDPVTFAAEFQNEPIQDLIESNTRFDLVAKDLMARLSGTSRGQVPEGTTHVTSGVDIQARILYYVTVAWGEDFGGVIVDWGTYPEQPVDYFRANDPPIPMQGMPENKNKPLAATIYTGLLWLKEHAFNKCYTIENSDIEMPITKVLLDSNWSMSTDCVYAFCKAEGGDKYFASHGRGITSENLPMDLWLKKKGEIKGKHWIYRQRTGETNRGRHYVFDTNYWKSTVAERLQAPLGSGNSILLWGVKDSPSNQPRYQQLRLLCDHLAGESMITKPGKNREVDLWSLKVSQENHYWDCLVLSAVSASASGLAIHEVMVSDHTAPTPKPARRVVAAPPATPAKSLFQG